MVSAEKDKDPVDVVRDFVEGAGARDDDVYVGIDPGGEGAIGFMCGPLVAVVDIPTFTVAVRRVRAVREPLDGGPKTRRIKGSTTQFDDSGIVRIFRKLGPVRDRVVVCLELAQVQVGGGRVRNSPLVAYKTGVGYGMWPLFLASQGYALEVVKPNVWKQRMGLSGQDKQAARAKAIRLWPGAPLRRKKDHNRAEALLLCEYIRRQRGQEKKR